MTMHKSVGLEGYQRAMKRVRNIYYRHPSPFIIQQYKATRRSLLDLAQSCREFDELYERTMYPTLASRNAHARTAGRSPDQAVATE